MEGLFNPLSILLHMVNACILLVALYFLLYKPVSKFMNTRSDTIAKELQDVKTEQAALEQQHVQAQEELNAAKRQAAETVAQAVSQAQAQAQQVLVEAHSGAEMTLKQARVEADAIKQNAKDDIRSEVATLSVDLAEKILQREVTPDDHSKLVDEFLKKVG